MKQGSRGKRRGSYRPGWLGDKTDGLTTGPQVHRLPVRVLPQHFWGEVSRCPCEPCSPDIQTGRHTHRGWHVSSLEQDPAGEGTRIALELENTALPQSWGCTVSTQGPW